MKLRPAPSSRRIVACLSASLAVAWLAVGCGSNGGVGDGVVDDGMSPGGSTSAGATNARAGAAHSAGASGRAGSTGSAGQGGSVGVAGAAGAAGAPDAGGASGASGAAAGGSAGTGVGGGGMSGSDTGSAGKSGSAAQGGGGAGTAGMPGGSGAAGMGSVGCGNGIVDSGEACDSGFNVVSGGSGGDGSGGAGTSGGGGDESRGGAPPVPATKGQVCSNTCYKVGTQACLDCENGGDCFESVNNCLGVLEPFNATQQTQCYAVMKCIQSSNCLDGTNTLGKCYCGSLNTTQCGAAPFTGAGSPDGACVNQIKAGFPSFSTNSAILGGLTATDFPSGAAMKRLSCQKGASGGQCLNTCGFMAGGAAFP